MTSKGPERLNLAVYPVVRLITTRVSDMDGYGHLNAVRLGQCYEDARATFYSSVLDYPGERRMPVVQLTIRYLAEGFWPGDLQIGTGVSRIGNASFEVVQGLFQNERCLGLCETVLVHTVGAKSAPIPDPMRTALERLRVSGHALA